jgi:RNA polymerase sigma-70 factor (ECF subfamily)
MDQPPKMKMPAKGGGPQYPEFFQTTEWSVVTAASSDDVTSEAALSRLCQCYLPSLRTYLISKGKRKDEADEILQSFFEYFLEKKIYATVTPEQGRFRCFLITAFKNFLNGMYDKSMAQKRGGGEAVVELDETMLARAGYLDSLVDQNSPEHAFEMQWAKTTVKLAMESLEQECLKVGKAKLFDALKGRLTGSEDVKPYADLVTIFGKSEESLRSDTRHLRKRFFHLLRCEVQRTLAPGISVDEEMEHLMHILTGG